MNNKPFSRLFKSSTALFLIIIFLMSLLSFVVDDKRIYALIGLCVWLALTVYSFLHEATREKELLEYIQTLSFHTDSTTKDSLLRFPLPLTVIRLDGTVIWYNEQFKNIFKIETMFDEHLNIITGADLDINKLFEVSSDGLTVKIGDNHFHLLVNVVHSDSEEIVAIIYWIDETKCYKLKSLYDESRPIVFNIMVDNFDEVMHNTADDSRAILSGTIEKTINAWANISGGILKKIERDKYILICENKAFNKYIESKFDILTSVKNINLGNKIPVTLSIGIGLEGDTLLQDDTFARNAIDMALGRGGDQVVIKNNTKFQYFGGNSKEVEKYTRVKSRVMAFALKQLVSQAEQVIIMGHKNADLDSFGASIGMLSAVKATGKPAYIVLETPNSFTHKMLNKFVASSDYSNYIINREQSLSLVTPSTLVIILDVFRPIITEVPQLLEKTDSIVVIDHHRKSAEFIENASLTYHEPYASSTSEIVTEILQYYNDGASINALVAEALYAGIELDTKSFTFKTGVRTFEAAAYLRRKGVDATNIKLLFQNDKTVYTLRTDIVKNSHIYKGCIAISTTESNYSDIQSITAAAADELLDIEGILASFTMCKINGTTYISGRSIGSINVQVILETMGGGGHISVAGAQLECDFDESLMLLKESIDKYFEDNKKE